MASFNQISLIGYLGGDPDFKTLPNGQNVASFSLSTTEKGYTRANGEQVPDRTDWHRISVWGKVAEVAQRYLHKGSMVMVQGALHYRQYTDRDSVNRTAAEITAETLQMLDRKPADSNTAQPMQAQPMQQQYQSQYQSGPVRQMAAYQQQLQQRQPQPMQPMPQMQPTNGNNDEIPF